MTWTTIDDLVERYFDSYECDTNDDIVYDNVLSMLDDFVSLNHYKINIEIIENEVGDVFSAIKPYNETLAILAILMKYAILCYVVLESTLIEKINERIIEIEDVDSDSDTE